MEGGGLGPQHRQPGEGGVGAACIPDMPVPSGVLKMGSLWDAGRLKGSVNTQPLSKQADRILSEERAGFPPAKGCGCGAGVGTGRWGWGLGLGVEAGPGVGPGAGAHGSHARSAPAPTCSAQERTGRAQATPGGKGRRVTPWQGAAEPEVPPSPRRKSATPRLSQQWAPPAQVPPGPCPLPGPRAPDGLSGRAARCAQ